MAKTKSGIYWVTWADAHAQNSTDINDLVDPFKTNAKAFIKALEDAGASVVINTTQRSPKRAYLFHWAWLIGLDKAAASEATSMSGVDIEWDHGNAADSKKGAKEMIKGFDLAVPPKSKYAPALNSVHIAGKAIDIVITWEGTMNVKKKDGTVVAVPFMDEANDNTKLHAVGKSYGLIKNTGDSPHWSVNGT